MRKIIDGRTYNTETSKVIGSWDNGYSTRDFNYCSETLYCNTRGAYFLHGEGHALSKYADNYGDMKGWGEEIIPMTEDEARSWAEKHLTAEEYEAEFGEAEEASPEATGSTSGLATRERVSWTIDAEIVSNMRKLKAATGMDISRLVDRALLEVYGEQFEALGEEEK